VVGCLVVVAGSRSMLVSCNVSWGKPRRDVPKSDGRFANVFSERRFHATTFRRCLSLIVVVVADAV